MGFPPKITSPTTEIPEMGTEDREYLYSILKTSLGSGLKGLRKGKHAKFNARG